jgi:hypothetical protein
VGGARGERGGRRRPTGAARGVGNGRRSRSRHGGRSVRARGQQLERIDVTVVLVRVPDAEVEIGPVVLEVAARADRPHLFTFGHTRSRRDGQRAEVKQGDGVAVGRLERERPAVTGKRPGEAHRSCRRCQSRLARRPGDVDAAMLPGLVLARGDDEGLQHRARRRPGPRGRSRGHGERRSQQDEHRCCQS